MCILGDVQIANSNKSLKHEVFLNLVSDKMRVPRLGPFTDQNGRFLYVYFELKKKKGTRFGLSLPV